MNVLETLKVESMRLRKERNPVAPSIVFAISEIEKFGKNNGDRKTTNDEAVKVVQKLIATIDQNLAVVEDANRKDAFLLEKAILSAVLPKMATDEEIIEFLDRKISELQETESPVQKGVLMKELRSNFGAAIDMKHAGVIMQEKFGI